MLLLIPLLVLIPGQARATFFCNIHVVIENSLFRMWNSDSNAAKTSVTTIFSNLNRVYTGTVFQEMNIQFQAAKITLGLDVCSDRLAAVDSKACLLKFSQITNSTEYCLHYLFTYRDFSNGHVGLAWPGVVCKESDFKTSFNTGLVSFINYGHNQTLTMVSENLAHEIGHNFGAIHDEDTESCNNMPGYIMGFSGTSLLTQAELETRSFSPCSERCIRQDLEAILNSRKGSPHEACKSKPEIKYKPFAYKKKMCFTSELIPPSEIVMHHTRASRILWGFLWSMVALATFLFLLCCCFYARSPITPTRYKMGEYLERISAESGASASLLLTRLSANASVGLSRLEVRTKDNIERMQHISPPNIRDQLDNMSTMVRDNVTSLTVKTRSNLESIRSAYMERESAKSHQTQVSTVSLDSFDDDDDDDATEAFLGHQGEAKAKFVKAAKREVTREDIELVHNTELVVKTGIEDFTPIIL